MPARAFSTVKPSIALLARLRKETEVSMTKAKEALSKNENDYDKALAWLHEDAQASGLKKAAKVAGRTAGEGLIGLTVLESLGKDRLGGSRAALVELNCETDFVSRNAIFKQLITQIASTSVILNDNRSSVVEALPVDQVLESPILPHPDSPATEGPLVGTVKEKIVETIGKLGENIALRRVSVIGGQTDAGMLLTPGYLHGGDEQTGKIGGVVALGVSASASSPTLALETLTKAKAFGRHLARQVVGFNPTSIDAEGDQNISGALLHQPFILDPNTTVGSAVAAFEKEQGLALRILGFQRWEAGEGIEKPEGDFADEVQRAVKVIFEVLRRNALMHKDNLKVDGNAGHKEDGAKIRKNIPLWICLTSTMKKISQSDEQMAASAITITPELDYSIDALSVFVFAVTLIGLIGVWKKNNRLMNLYFLIIVSFIGYQVISATLAYLTSTSWMQDNLDRLWGEAYEKDRNLIRDIQAEFQCRGYNDPTDRAATMSFFDEDEEVLPACAPVLLEALGSKFSALAMTMYSVRVVQLLAVLLVCGLFYALITQDEEEEGQDLELADDDEVVIPAPCRCQEQALNEKT
ncbi:hypothetical protein BZG36_02050 [Bifiguratus adelaidae]|uniref:Elongation factor Ts, mitochondrial n=1 Tax=Bifiguratus adelaidae TaxID=1938954 RepID=A0A261Y1Y5_9FUNG|nr:hypothetical protein BZG36_02050 [Bifiguratus adelaidae]